MKKPLDNKYFFGGEDNNLYRIDSTTKISRKTKRKNTDYLFGKKFGTAWKKQSQYQHNKPVWREKKKTQEAKT